MTNLNTKILCHHTVTSVEGLRIAIQIFSIEEEFCMLHIFGSTLLITLMKFCENNNLIKLSMYV